MLHEIAKTILEFLKLAPRYLIAFGAAAAFLLLSSEQTLKRLGLVEFTHNNRAILGMVLVGSVALFGVWLISGLLNSIKRWWRKRKFHRHMIQRLNRLTEDEKQILRYYLAANSRANTLRVDDGVVQELVAEGIIHRSASLGNVVEGFAHNIDDFAWNYLHVYPHVLEGSTRTARSDKMERW
jgi:Super-infection exclusion protein B